MKIQMIELEKEKFKKLLLEAGFVSKVQFANVLGIQAQAIVRWKQRDICPSHITKALEWARLAKEYDKIKNNFDDKSLFQQRAKKAS